MKKTVGQFLALTLATLCIADGGGNLIVIYGPGQQAGSFHVDNVRFRALTSEEAGNDRKVHYSPDSAGRHRGDGHDGRYCAATLSTLTKATPEKK